MSLWLNQLSQGRPPWKMRSNPPSPSRMLRVLRQYRSYRQRSHRRNCLRLRQSDQTLVSRRSSPKVQKDRTTANGSHLQRTIEHQRLRPHRRGQPADPRPGRRVAHLVALHDGAQRSVSCCCVSYFANYSAGECRMINRVGKLLVSNGSREPHVSTIYDMQISILPTVASNSDSHIITSDCLKALHMNNNLTRLTLNPILSGKSNFHLVFNIATGKSFFQQHVNLD